MPTIPAPLTSGDITRAIALRHFSYRKNIVVPRCTFTGWEADVLVLRPSAWLEEVEIKISVADFRREFATKADKHRRFTHGAPKYHGNLEGFDAANALHEPFGRCWNGKPAGYWDWSAGAPHRLRRFWFAVTEEILPKVEADVPAYAGILCAYDYFGRTHIREVRPAPILKHGRKLTDAERLKLTRLAYLRYWDVFERDMATEVSPQ